jgi:Protein of unknown function (DUF4054)
MALDLNQFRTRKPEFQGVNNELINLALAAAVKRLSPGVLGDSYDDAQAELAAHILASNPWGAQARLSGTKDGSTVYSAALAKIVREKGAGFGIT